MFYLLDKIYIAGAVFIGREHCVHTEHMKTQWKRLWQEPPIKKSLTTTGAFGLYLMNAGFFCCRALRPCEQGYAPNDLQYLFDQLQCANPFACMIALLDGLVAVSFLVWGLWQLWHHRTHG